MKYLGFIGLFLVGGVSGYFIGTMSTDETQEVLLDEAPEPITEVIYDTIVEKERVEVPVYIPKMDSVVFEDTLVTDTLQLDSLVEEEEIVLKDSIMNDGTEEFVINRDQKKGSKKILITYLTEPEESDSLLKERLGINDSRPTSLQVQFWESPLHYEGYKLSKRTLILYGISPQMKFEILAKNDRYYLLNDEFCYELTATTDFLPYKNVDKAPLFE